MKEREFKTQVFQTAGQWGSGLLYRLEALSEGGIAISSVPSFTTKVEEIWGITAPIALAVDCCGIIYLFDAATRRLFRHDSKTGVSERIFCPETIGEPCRILLDGFRLWFSDTAARLVGGCSLVSFQRLLIIDSVPQPLDIAVTSLGDLYVLDGETHIIYRFDRRGSLVGSFGAPLLQEPLGMSIVRGDALVVLDKKAGFLGFSREGNFLGAADLGDIIPVWIAGDSRETIFVLNDAGQVYQFDPDGSAVGLVKLPPGAGQVLWIAADKSGQLYASTAQGIFIFGSEKTFTKQKGFYYSKTLDSGIKECPWHRLALDVDLPSGTVVDIYSYASDKDDLKAIVDAALTDPAKTLQQKVDYLDKVIPWADPENNAKDMLFKYKNGRYLWLKLALATYDEKVRPAVRQMKILYPRLSYLRYLPAIYQDDPVNRDFLERFLSLYESIFSDLEIDISTVSQYFDPDTTPPGFLKWLASWVNIAVEDEWPEAMQREFIRQAARLYTIKGTVAGLSLFIEIYTGKPPTILESGGAFKPFVLGGSYRLGIDSLLVGTPIRGFRLGDDSILGRVGLRDTVQEATDPFLPLAYRFTVVVNMTQEERTRLEKGLTKIITEEKPAHTDFSLRFAGIMQTGASSIGIDSSVGGFDPLRLGSSTVGGGLLLAPEEDEAGTIGERAIIGMDTRLI